MRLDWAFTAESYLDQLPREERSKVLHAVESLPTAWNTLGAARLARIESDPNDLYSLRVGADLRVIVRQRDDLLTVVDVIRRSQIDGLRRLTASRRAVS